VFLVGENPSILQEVADFNGGVSDFMSNLFVYVRKGGYGGLSLEGCCVVLGALVSISCVGAVCVRDEGCAMLTYWAQWTLCSRESVCFSFMIRVLLLVWSLFFRTIRMCGIEQDNSFMAQACDYC